MGVIMQAFYWECPQLESKEFEWWRYVKEKTKELSDTGFTALWLPPASKAANARSMGYDPYDYYDLGEIDQKGSVNTWFGSRQALEELIQEAHGHNMQVYADLVLNHTSGADAEEINGYDGKSRWTKYDVGSGKFKRNWTCYHPSWFERLDDKGFEDMPDLCHRNPEVYSELMELARWMIEDVGFDGFRYDFAKGYGTWLITAILERLYNKSGMISFSPFGVGEYWDADAPITQWLTGANAFSSNPVRAFDFPLRERLKGFCDYPGFTLTTLIQRGTLINDGLEGWAVTFVENHDIVRDDPIVNDKMLAYAYILTHEGYPCVFWQDYFNWDLAQANNNSGIAALVQLHEQYAGGDTNILHCTDDLYIMQRTGYSSQIGLVLVLNNNDQWNGETITTKWQNRRLVPKAWRGKDNADVPMEKWTDDSGSTDLWAPPRGYVVYVPM